MFDESFEGRGSEIVKKYDEALLFEIWWRILLANGFQFKLFLASLIKNFETYKNSRWLLFSSLSIGQNLPLKNSGELNLGSFEWNHSTSSQLMIHCTWTRLCTLMCDRYKQASRTSWSGEYRNHSGNLNASAELWIWNCCVEQERFWYPNIQLGCSKGNPRFP